MVDKSDVERVSLTVTIEVVKDGTEDVALLLEQIRGQRGSLDIAGFRFAAEVASRPSNNAAAITWRGQHV